MRNLWLLAPLSWTIMAACTQSFDQFTESDSTSSFNGGATHTSSAVSNGGASSAVSNGGTTTTSSPGSGGSTAGVGGSQAGVGGSGGSLPTINVRCPDRDCDVSGSGVCCLTKGSSGNPSECLSSGQCETDEASIKCDGPADCSSNEICCGDLNFEDGGFSLIECRSNCNGNNIRVVCDSNGECSGGDTCQNTEFLPSSYKVCI